MNTDKHHDVAIIGCGPSGVVAAALLAQAGLRVFVCDRQREVYDKPRAIAIDHEIMRVFQQLGLLAAIEPFAEPFTPSEYFGVQGQLIKRMTMVPPPYPLGHTPSMVFTQPPMERALRARVAEWPGVTMALGTELMSLAQDAQGVTLRLRAEGAERTLRARYVLGCDGASSSVRSMAGIALEDLGFDEPWLVVDVLVNPRGLAKLPKTSVQRCDPERPCTFVIGPRNHRRWEISLKPGEDPADVMRPEKTWELLAPWLTPQDGTLWRQASYRFHALVADRWRAGRVFIAGDAAHQQPPFLGQGMCQGVRDVANLAWKLAAVCRGEVAGRVAGGVANERAGEKGSDDLGEGPAAQALLDSYAAERAPHVRELTRRIKAIGAVICERDPQRARERDAHLLAECGGTVQDTPRQDVLPRLEAGCLSRVESAARGTIFQQPWVVTGDGTRRRLDDLTGHGWLLFTDGAFDGALDGHFGGDFGSHLGGEVPDPVDLRRAAGVASRVASVRICPPQAADSHADRAAPCPGGWREADGVVAAWMQRHGCHAALVRPDRYVFGIASTAAALRSLLDEQAAWMGLALPPQAESDRGFPDMGSLDDAHRLNPFSIAATAA